MGSGGPDDSQRLPLAEVAAETQLPHSLITVLLGLVSVLLEVKLCVLEVTRQGACGGSGKGQ